MDEQNKCIFLKNTSIYFQKKQMTKSLEKTLTILNFQRE